MEAVPAIAERGVPDTSRFIVSPNSQSFEGPDASTPVARSRVSWRPNEAFPTEPRKSTVFSVSSNFTNGKYLVLVGGQVADVEESLAAGREVGGDAVLDFVFLPHVHPDAVSTMGGARAPAATDALGIVETTTVAAAILAADAGVKGARVRLVELRLADGLGGKGVVLFSGLVADVEAAVRLGTGALERPESPRFGTWSSPSSTPACGRTWARAPGSAAR